MGERLVSLMLSEVSHANIAVKVAAAGADSFIIDMEHGSYAWPDVAAMVTVGRGVGLHPVIRIPEVRRETVMHALDCGAEGVLAPYVRRAEEIEELVRLARYPPDGERGAALLRAHSAYDVSDEFVYRRRANERVTVMVMVETRELLSSLDDCFAVEGLDVAFVGPTDLAATVGVRGGPEALAMQELYEAVAAATGRHGVALGVQAYSQSLAERFCSLGARYVSITSDVSLLVNGLRSEVEQLRAAGTTG